MPYLLDSDILIYYTNGIASIQYLFEHLASDGLAVSAVSYMETKQGISRSPDPVDAQERLDNLLIQIPVIAFSRPEAHRCAMIREDLQGQGKRIRQRALDLMIAATAMEHGLTLLTNNPSDYVDIQGLLIETPQTI